MRRTFSSGLMLGTLVAVLAVTAFGCSNKTNTGTGSTTPPAGSATTSPPAPATSATTPEMTTSPTPTPAASAGGLSGTWNGTYSGAFSGTFTLTWTQTGSALSGNINLSTGGPSTVNGTLSGNSIQFGTVGSSAITYTGTVSSNSMSGTYKVQGGTVSDTGSWNATKSS